MTRLTWKIWDLLHNRRARTATRSKAPTYRPLVECLESRLAPANVDPASLSGLVYFDGNNNNVRDAAEGGLGGITVALTNTDGLTITTETDDQGAFVFSQLHPGTYTLSRGSSDFGDGQIAAGSLGGTVGSNAISAITVAEGQAGIDYLFGMQTLALDTISVRLFLASAPDLFPEAGLGTTSSAPFVRTDLPDLFMEFDDEADEVVDLAGFFSDPDTSNSRVRFNTNLVDPDDPQQTESFTVELLDAQAPRTVANFFNYIDEGKYNDALFHRRAASPDILQGGGLTISATTATTSSVTDIVTDGFTATDGPRDFAVDNEFDATNRPNDPGTIAMAKTSDPNSATNEFFFNIGDNSTDLDTPNNSGGFTVFGRTLAQEDRDVLTRLAAVQPGGQSNYVFTPANFPTNLAKDAFAVVTSVDVVKRTEVLTYSATSSNTDFVTATIHDNRLVVHMLKGDGVATITVRATDETGAFVEDSFVVSGHFHPTLEINVLGQTVAIPKDVGIVTGADIHGGAFNPHTHDITGTLHAGERLLAGIDPEGSEPRPVTVGDFFDVWRTTNPGTAQNRPDAFFDSTRIFDNFVDDTHRLTFTVNGQLNTEFDNYVLHDGDDIVISYEQI